MPKRTFYSNAYIYLALGFIATLIGFYPTYFSKLGEADGLHHFHGITGSLWMIVLIIQPIIYRFGNMKYHRLVGWISVGIAPFVLFGAYQVIRHMMQSREPSDLLYQFAFLDVFTILPFALFLSLGIAYRKRMQYHARFMICTIFGPLSAGVVRIFHLIFQDWGVAITSTYVSFEIILLLMIVDDKRSGKVRSPYILALSIFALQHIFIYDVAKWDRWRELTELLALQ